METYCIKLHFQNPYIGSRSGGDKVLYSSMSLEEAKTVLLNLYNRKYDWERPFASNWGLAVIQSKPFAFGANKTQSDGTRSFDWDSRIYFIEKEED